MERERISVIGSGGLSPSAEDQALAQWAEALGGLLARAGYDVVCGGLGGVMEAVCRGAKAAGAAAIGILPGNDTSSANPHVTIPIATGLGQMRNHLVVANGRACVAVGGGGGTLSEIGLALKLGRPVAATGHWSGLPGIHAVATPEEAIDWISKQSEIE